VGGSWREAGNEHERAQPAREAIERSWGGAGWAGVRPLAGTGTRLSYMAGDAPATGPRRELRPAGRSHLHMVFPSGSERRLDAQARLILLFTPELCGARDPLETLAASGCPRSTWSRCAPSRWRAARRAWRPAARRKRCTGPARAGAARRVALRTLVLVDDRVDDRAPTARGGLRRGAPRTGRLSGGGGAARRWARRPGSAGRRTISSR
jgi:hypothetical protein